MNCISHELYLRLVYDGLYRNIHATPGVTTPKAGPWDGEIILYLGLAGCEIDCPIPRATLLPDEDEGEKLLPTGEKNLY